MSFSTWVFWGLAAHVVIFYLHTEQSPVCAHAQLVPFQTLIEIHISSGIRDACGVEHDWSVEDDTVLLQRKKTASILTYFSLPALKVHCVIIEVTLCYGAFLHLSTVFCFFCFFFKFCTKLGNLNPSITSHIKSTSCNIPHLQPWARCLHPFWTPQSGPWCWRPRFHEWWPCYPL